MKQSGLPTTKRSQLTFEYGGPPFHVVLVPADPPELGGALPSGQVI